ncbi:MAG TPA: hypothetical protein VF316_04580, partial [Polyangiaceae bacterium]
HAAHRENPNATSVNPPAKRCCRAAASSNARYANFGTLAVTLELRSDLDSQGQQMQPLFTGAKHASGAKISR